MTESERQETFRQNHRIRREEALREILAQEQWWSMRAGAATLVRIEIESREGYGESNSFSKPSLEEVVKHIEYCERFDSRSHELCKEVILEYYPNAIIDERCKYEPTILTFYKMNNALTDAKKNKDLEIIKMVFQLIEGENDQEIFFPISRTCL